MRHRPDDPPGDPEPEESRSLSLKFTPAAYKQLEDLACRKQKTISETIRDALALETWFQDTRLAGGHVLYEEQGKLRELTKV